MAKYEAMTAAAAFPASPATLPDGEATSLSFEWEAPKASVLHLACHGFAELASPLDSGLLLAGGQMTLGRLMELHLRVRLAVLSACETALPGTELPDEVVALPTGLLQAGVAGVVASQWSVPDRATAMLMAEFYRCWRQEQMTPAAALQAAQRWLRDTTNAQKIHWVETALAQHEAWLPASRRPELPRRALLPRARSPRSLQPPQLGRLRLRRCLRPGTWKEGTWKKMSCGVPPRLSGPTCPISLTTPAERTAIEADLTQALDQPPGTAHDALRKAIASHSVTRDWMRRRTPVTEDRRPRHRPFWAGRRRYWVCCSSARTMDYSFVRETVTDEVPLCPHDGSVLQAPGPVSDDDADRLLVRAGRGVRQAVGRPRPDPGVRLLGGRAGRAVVARARTRSEGTWLGARAVATTTWLRGLPGIAQAVFIVVGLILLAASALIAERLTVPLLQLLEGYWPRPRSVRNTLIAYRRWRRRRWAKRVSELAVSQLYGGLNAAEYRELRSLEAAPLSDTARLHRPATAAGGRHQRTDDSRAGARAHVPPPFSPPR